MSELWVRTIERKGLTEHYLTAAQETRRPVEEAAQDLLGRMAERLARDHIVPLQVKLYGSTRCRDRVETILARQWKDRGIIDGLAPTWIEGAPPWGGGFAGLQVWGIVPGPGAAHRVRTIEGGGADPARLWEGPDFRMLLVPSVMGREPDGALAATVTGQAEGMFRGALRALDRSGFAYRQVARTWIYFARLLDWYGEFNRVRTAHHAGLAGNPGVDRVAFPASTGIQGRAGDEECFLELLAIDGDAIRVEPVLGTSRQVRAFSYGSAFSRGMSLAWGGATTIHVSGTASIDSSGASVHLEHSDAQALETLCSVAAVLDTRGARLSDVVTATVFCKRPADFEAYRRVTRLLQLPTLPAVYVLADVCRPELLVEIEAVAATADR